MSAEAIAPAPEVEGHAAAATTPNPWPGLASYTEDQRHLFFGRTAEINEMTRLVQRETLTVLFGRSGLGKSSLLRAGVMPKLRENDYFPATLRLDFSERATITPVEQVKALALAAAREAGVEAEGVPENAGGLTLWEWFHAVEFWGPRNDPVTPILALDQFEEVFTLGRNAPATADFIEQLADLIENRVPQAVRDRAERNGERLAVNAARQEYKVILSLREDFVPRLDGLRPVLPAIMRNRFALAPLDAECACAVVLGAGRTWIAEDDAKEIVAAVVGGRENADAAHPLVYQPDAEVEPAYLSVMCHELFRRMQALGRNAITRDLIAAERGNILEGLYTRSFEGIGDHVRFFVEDRLLTPSGFRGTLPLADATQEGVAETDLRTLVDRRLLRFEDRLGTIHMELSHDLLTRIVLKRRESRRAEAALRVETERAARLRAEQRRQRRRSRIVTGVAAALALLLLGTLWGGYYCFLQEHRAFYRIVNFRRGFPVGIGRLSAAQAARLPAHYIVVYKGMTWDGWRPRWKPPIRLLAADQRGNLTINHSVGTFFWRAHDEAQATELNRDRGTSLGLAAVCQWEYVTDAEGGIAYSRGLDREGRMAWGCVYSPTATNSSSARIAHYVGPDGFPQLQNKSAAEYIEVHYDANGWEDRVLYLDAMARPAAGLDGAFGIAREFDRVGNMTSLLSLDEHGQPMIDRAGNCGLRLTYDADGLCTEVTSVGTDGKIAPVSDGWAHVRNEYDAAGRQVMARSFDENNRSVVRRSNVCNVASAYGESGDLVLESYFGPDDRPMAIIGGIVATRHDFDGEGNEVRTTFLDGAGQPGAARDGSCGYESRYDARRNLIARTPFGPDGRPFLLALGYAGWKSEFDDFGRETRRTHYDAAGKPATFKEGSYHGWETRYDARGNPIKYTYLGTDGKPAFSSEQIAGWDASFDPRGREVSRTFFGAAGEPAIYTEGYHGYATTYDERGYEAETTYLDLGGKPMAISKNYAGWKLEHDSQGRETKRTYFDAAGKPVNCKDGYHGLTYWYDARGNLAETTTIGLDGQPFGPSSSGYATERKKFDGQGNVVEQSYADAYGNRTTNGDGVYAVENRFSVQGWLLEERYRDADGKPMANKQGVHYWTIGCDAFGNRTRLATFGLHDEPVAGILGAQAKTIRFDARGNEVESAWLGHDGKPVLNKDGYAALRMEYDERNNHAATAYFDAAGQPCLGLEKIYRWVRTFSERREVLRWDFFGVDGKPGLGTGGYSALETEYNARGQETRKTFLGADGKPLVQSSGYAAERQSFNASGQLERTEYEDAEGKPTLCENGYRSFFNKYDKDGQLFTRTWVGLAGLTAYATGMETYFGGAKRIEQFLSADGSPVNCAVGYARLNIDRDEAGNMIRAIYTDAEGKPAYGDRGYAGGEIVSRVLKYYDAAGREMPDVEHGSVRPLLYVVYLRAADCVAAKGGLRPGDLLWQAGDFYYPALLDKLWEKYDDLETVRKEVYAAWRKATYSSDPAPLRVTVVRDGQLVELTLPMLPATNIGIRYNLRRVPNREYDDLVARYGKPR